MFSPGLNSELKDLIQKCEVCCSLHAKQPREQLQRHPLAERPWTEGQSVSLNHVHARATECRNSHNAQPQQATFEAARDQFRDRSLPTGVCPVYGGGAGLFTLEISAYLITGDYYSGFWEIDQSKGLGTTSVIRCLKRHLLAMEYLPNVQQTTDHRSCQESSNNLPKSGCLIT